MSEMVEIFIRRLVIPILVGLVLIGSAAFMTELDHRNSLYTEIVKDLGVVVLGLSVVSLVWMLSGGDPIQTSLNTH